MLSFLNTLARGLGWLILFALALAGLAFVIGMIAYWVVPDRGLASPEDLDDPEFGLADDEEKSWPEFHEPEADAVITSKPAADQYSDLPPGWISPESVPDPASQTAAWLPPPPQPARINGSPVFADAKPNQPCAD